MKREATDGLSRRERQIMDVVYRLGDATVADVLAGIPEAPSYSTVRALMRVLTDKGQLTYSSDGPRYVYRATTPREDARTSALQRVLRTFFDGSPSEAMAALMTLPDADLTSDELDQLEALIQEARREGR